MVQRNRLKSALFVAIGVLIMGVTTPGAAADQHSTLDFSGYTWSVRSGSGGPGPNDWDADHVWLDEHGYLHLKIAKVDGRWRCAEVTTTQRLGFGRYQFQVSGALDRLDRNVVLGLFNYPTPDVGADASNEIDIEFARWGNPAYPPGNYTVWPAQAGLPPRHAAFDFNLPDAASTHRFTWTAASILFQSFAGYRNNQHIELARRLFQPKAYEKRIPQNPLPVHINLWLYRGLAPTDDQPVEVVIRRFGFRAE
ncbi:MAG: hypothetical protein EPN21_01075 [Methylococcaceae bacterium]|nr:MAG: hypothetical protein EPN21_01075 [Methylococcaceae bacterium]